MPLHSSNIYSDSFIQSGLGTKALGGVWWWLLGGGRCFPSAWSWVSDLLKEQSCTSLFCICLRGVQLAVNPIFRQFGFRGVLKELVCSKKWISWGVRTSQLRGIRIKPVCLQTGLLVFRSLFALSDTKRNFTAWRRRGTRSFDGWKVI